MKFIRVIGVSLFLIVVFALLGVYIFFRLHGKELCEQKLSRALKRDVTITQVRFVFPLGLRLDEVTVQGVLKAKELRAYLGLASFVGKEIVLSHLTINEPLFALIKRQGSALSICDIGAANQPVEATAALAIPLSHKFDNSSSTGPSKKGGRAFLIEDMTVSRGRVDFFDFSKEEPFQATLDQIEAKASAIPYPLRSMDTKFHLTAFLKGAKIPFAGGRLETKGWVNILEHNMKGTLEIAEGSGRVQLSADVEAVNNDMTIQGRVDLSHLRTSPQEDTNTTSKSVDELILGALTNSGISLTANFNIKTKLDDIQLNTISFGGEVGTQKEGTLQESLKNIGKQFEDLGKKLSEPQEAPAPEEPSVNAVAP